MTTIFAKTFDQVLSAVILPKVTSGNQNSVRLHVEFDEKWDGYAKSATFYTSVDPTVYEKVLSSEGECVIPAEVLARSAHLYIYVKGVNSGTRMGKSTSPICFKVLPGTPSMVISDPADSVYAQLLTELSVLQARVSALVALEDGSTTGDAELQDVRIGADGAVYESAGAAVREQYKNLKASMNRYVGEPINLFNKDSADNEFGYYLKYNATGTDVSGCGVSHPIYVEFGDSFVVKYPQKTYGKNIAHGFAADGTYVTQFDCEVDTENSLAIVTINRIETAYIRLNITNSPNSSVPYEQCMIVRGTAFADIPNEYIPFGVNSSNMGRFVTAENLAEDVLEPFNPLYGKVAVFDGDSISHGTSVGSDDPTYGYGWAGRIGEKNSMNWHNVSKSGGTITSDMYAGEAARHWVSTNIDEIYSAHPDLDYLILEGGTNDADLLGVENIGEISDTSVMHTDFDPSADFTQALEYLFSKAVALYPTKKIGFVIAPKMGTSAGSYANSNRRVYFDRCIEVCKKYGIPYLDLWYGCHLNPALDRASHGGDYFMYTDGQHLSSNGYNYVSDIIEEWMKTL